MMRLSLDGKRINFPTHIDIEEHLWDKDRQRVKGSSELSVAFNKRLLQLKSNAWDYYNELCKLDKPTMLEAIRDAVLHREQQRHSLVPTIDYLITNMKARVHLDIAPATIKNYEAMKRKVQQFLSEVRKQEDVWLSELSHTFIQEFDHYLRVNNRLHNNGIVKHMQQLKRVIKVAILNEWIGKDPFASYQCKIIEPKRIHLTREELQLLVSLVLPTERLQKVKDVFLFSCYTGLAYADVSKLNSQHLHYINGQRWVVLDRTKTKNQSVIPLLPAAEGILERYRHQKTLLPIISSQNINKYLKEVAQLAGITKRLSFHAARHTFATTVTLNEGVDIMSVSAMLGHKLLKTTQIYARVNMQKIASDMQKLNKRGG